MRRAAVFVLSLLASAGCGPAADPPAEGAAEPATAASGEPQCVRAFFADRAPMAAIEELAALARRADPRARVLVLSKRDALRLLDASWPDLTAGLDGNPLPRTLEVVSASPGAVAALTAALESEGAHVRGVQVYAAERYPRCARPVPR